MEKFSKIIDTSVIEIYYNSEGLDAVNFAGVGELAKNFSVAEMLDRDNFSKRYKEGKRISLQEFLYPLMQGYDSVCIARKYGSCDVELGGNDQYFNLLAGRKLMDAHGLPKQDIMTFDLLMGTDGQKMSKTKPNCIYIDDAPADMYQKIINLKDDLIVNYYTFITDATLEEIDIIKTRLENGEHPNIFKEDLARRIIKMCHNKEYDPNDASNIAEMTIAKAEISVAELLKITGFATTGGDIRNAVAGGSVRVDGRVVTDSKEIITIAQNGILFEMGKKKAKRIFVK